MICLLGSCWHSPRHSLPSLYQGYQLHTRSDGEGKGQLWCGSKKKGMETFMGVCLGFTDNWEKMKKHTWGSMQTSRVSFKIEEVKYQNPNPHLSSVLLVLQPYMLQFSRQPIHKHNSISYLITVAAAHTKHILSQTYSWERSLWPGAADNLHYLFAQGSVQRAADPIPCTVGSDFIHCCLL